MICILVHFRSVITALFAVHVGLFLKSDLVDLLPFIPFLAELSAFNTRRDLGYLDLDQRIF